MEEKDSLDRKVGELDREKSEIAAALGEREEEVRRLKQKVGELVLDNDILKEAVKRSAPLAQRTSEES